MESFHQQVYKRNNLLKKQTNKKTINIFNPKLQKNFTIHWFTDNILTKVTHKQMRYNSDKH